MKVIVMLLAGAALATSCKKNTTDDTKGAPAPSTGSATVGSGSGSISAAQPKPMAADDRAKQFHVCWGYWAGGKWDDFKGCYANDAVSEAPGSGLPSLNGSSAISDSMKTYRTAFPNETVQPQLVLVSGKKLIGVTLLTGKQTGSLKTSTGELAATNKPFGLYLGQVLTTDDPGKVTHEWDFFDMTTLVGQLQPFKDHPVRAVADKLAMPEQVVIGNDDAKEKANLATVRHLVEKFNKPDLKGFGELVADDVVWSEQPMAKDETKKDLVTNLPQMWKGFSDLKFLVTDAWTAGDYVAAAETFEGTNDGDLPMMHLKKTGKKVSLPFLAIHRLDAGKVKATWIFFQGGGFASQLGLEQNHEGANNLTKK